MNNPISIGIMQGRLTHPKGRGIQFFPFEEWKEEFALANKLGINEIEFIFDLDRYQENPLWTEAGRKEIKELIAQSGVKVNHICADFFMRRPFFRNEDSVIAENIVVLKKLIQYSAEIGAKNIEIPILDNASLKTKEEEALLLNAVKDCLPLARQYDIRIGIEADLRPDHLVQLIAKFESPSVHVVYDSGNSSGLGYNCAEEVAVSGHLFGNVHIKDRLKGGTTVSLGTGSANFDHLFQGLADKKYIASFILQAARGEDGKEEQAITKYMQLVKDYLVQYKFS